MYKKLNGWKKTLWGGVLLLALQAASFAQTAEITLYEAPGFGGRSLTLRGYTPNLEQIGFNDRAASIVVRSGNWQLCTDANFGGTCTTLTRGEYRNLDGRIDGQLSSAREVGINSNETGNYGNYRRGSIEVFDRPDFQGTSILLDRDSTNFSNNGFNDRARSIIVHDGTWTLCTARGYGGDCRTYARGRYANLGRGTAGEVSSARMSGGDIDAPYVHGGGVVVGGQSAGATNLGIGRVILFDDERMNGRSMVAVENMVDLASTGFNDEVASIVVEGGSWEFCTDAFFRGQCRVLKPGQYRRLDPILFRSISSLRAASSANGDFLAQNRGQTNSARPAIELFEHDDFQGRRLASRGGITDLERENFNDIASSVIVYEGRWELCTDADFGGRCAVYGPGRYPKLWGLSDQLSSIRRVDR